MALAGLLLRLQLIWFEEFMDFRFDVVRYLAIGFEFFDYSFFDEHNEGMFLLFIVHAKHLFYQPRFGDVSVSDVKLFGKGGLDDGHLGVLFADIVEYCFGNVVLLKPVKGVLEEDDVGLHIECPRNHDLHSLYTS